MTAEAKQIEAGSQEWHEWRAQGIGGSDAAVIVGVDPYRNIVDLVKSKRGVETIEENEAMRRGKLLEDPIRKAIEITTGRTVTGEECVNHPDIPWLRATLDGRFADTGEPVQIKTHAAYPAVAEKYTDNTYPEHEYVQVAHEMVASGEKVETLVVFLAAPEVLEVLAGMVDDGVEADYIAKSIASYGLKIYRQERNEGLESSLLAAEKDFYERYIVGAETPVDIKKAETTSGLRDATEDEAIAVAQLKAAYIERERASVEYERIKTQLQAAIGTGEGITAPDGKITWKKSADKEFTKTDWEGLAVRLLAGLYQEDIDALIAEYSETGVKVGSRSFRVPTAKWKKEL